MDLKDIAAVSGKGGLFKVVKPTRTGVILESIDASKTKLIANANNRISLLKEISVYTTTKESSLPIEDVFKTIFEKYGNKISVSSKSSENELQNFLGEVVPEYDRERVYNSDIKKIISWYAILIEQSPDIFEKEKVEIKKEEKKEEKKSVKKGDDVEVKTSEKTKAKAKAPAKKK